MCVSRFKLPRLFVFVKKCVKALSFNIVELSRRRLEQVPELIVLTNSKSFENLKLKRKEKKRKRKPVIYNKYNVCAR
jgi:hypothetical protein